MKMELLLPRLPSELLRIAIDDFKATIKQGYKIKMSKWGIGEAGDSPSKCSVCFAGAVMLQRTKKDQQNIGAFGIRGINADQYGFLDQIRRGELNYALKQLSIYHSANNTSNNKFETVEVDYITHIAKFKRFKDCNTPEVFTDQLEEIVIYFKSKNL